MFSSAILCVVAAGLLCDPGADGALVVLPEDPLQAAALHRRGRVCAWGRSDGGSRPACWKRPGLKWVLPISYYTLPFSFYVF